MAKRQMQFGDKVVQPAVVQPAPWARSHGEYISGQAYIDEADQAAVAADGKWGVGRLRLLVGPELREKFDRQRYLFNQAIWHGDLEAVRRESGRMENAYRALDAAAVEQPTRPHEVLEVALADGTVAVIVPDNRAVEAGQASGRQVAVYTLAEIGRLLSAYPDIVKAKQIFPGAEVTDVRPPPRDPLESIIDTELGLEEVLA